MAGKVVVTGAGGQVGRAVVRRKPEWQSLAHAELDVTDAADVRQALRGAELVVHAAALTNVDGCEADPELAQRVNGEGTRNVAEAAREEGCRVIYLSTDYVFDGTKLGEYVEDDHPNPINEYGRSKLEGERHVLKDPASLVVRTSWVIGEGGNFVRTILAAAAARDVLQVVDDQIGRPTFAGDLADALVVLVEREVTGLVHVAGSGRPCTWADLAENAIALRGLAARVERITSEDYAARSERVVAPRPKNSVLSLDKARSLDIPLAEWRPSLQAYVGAGL